jgi:lipid-A-disaccharide synthase
VEFVGHPFVSPGYAAPVALQADGPVLLLPGSRKQVVARVFPVLLEAYRLAGTKRDAVVLYPGAEIRQVLEAAKPPANVALRETGAAGGPVGAAAVLTASGTMSMHCALAGLPGALTYRTDELTYLLGRLLVNVKYIGIANLLLGEPMYPEFIQGAATPAALADQLRLCLDDPARREATAAQARRLRGLLHQPASGTAADWLARWLSN